MKNNVNKVLFNKDIIGQLNLREIFRVRLRIIVEMGFN